jgi:DNA-binding transcriptional ArsR family regulator
MEVAMPKKPPAERRGGPPYLGPITEAALGRPGEQGPPPLISEWGERITGPGNFVVLWAGSVKRQGLPGGCAWSRLTTSTSSPDDDADAEGRDGMPPPEDTSLAPKLERMLTPLAHESRVRIMQALYVSPCSSSALSEATGLKGGNLYHHLRELLYAAYVHETDDGYALTDLGLQLLVTLTCIAWKAVVDRADEGLAISDHF